METELHPSLAFQAGIEQEKINYDVHPSLATHIEGSTVENQPQVQQEMVQTETEVTEPEPEQPVESVQPPVESPKDRDWREVRQRADEARILKRELELRDKEIELLKNQTHTPTSPNTEDEYLTDTEKKLKQKLAQYEQQTRTHAEKLKQLEQQNTIARAEQRLYAEYPDIKEVVSDENIQKLQDQYPNLYNSVISSSDIYTVGSAAYEMIMAKGIHKKTQPILQQLTQNASRNANKPRSSSSISADSVAPQPGQTPIQRANSYMGNSISSEEERQALYKEMVTSSRNRI